MIEIVEATRRIPVAESYDVIVCGGGPAGACAAISAGRAGAKTLLIESQGCLGGTWTSGLMGFAIDTANKSGIINELKQALTERNAIKYSVNDGNCFTFDIEMMKLLLEELCAAAGVTLLYHTMIADAVVVDGKITHVVTESKSGRQAFAGARFIDCTGDGDLSALAGCGYEIGVPETGITQPMSFLALLAGIDASGVKEFIAGGNPEAKKRLLREFRKAGVDPSYGEPSLFKIDDDLFWLMANHQYGVSAVNAADVTQATIDGRREVFTLVDALRSLGGVWKNVKIVSTSSYIGVREGRRIDGLKKIVIDDLITGKEYDAPVCSVNFGVDVHSVDPHDGKGCNVKNKIAIKVPYGIPPEALISKDVDNLMMAGRCISGDFLSHASYRVTGDAATMGEYAGMTAAGVNSK